MTGTSGSPNHLLDSPESEWTSRQKEVLDLLVRGRTNGQIADALGISLAGAKWHVSEIISKLGVESREEAAEYWRARNGLRLRFTRALRALLPSAIWLNVGGTIAGLAAVSAAVVAVVALREAGSNEQNSAAAATTPAATGTASAGAPAATPSTPATGPTGNPNIDRVIAAIATGDSSRITDILQFTKVACVTTRGGIGSPPECPQGVAEKTLVEVFSMEVGCDGGWAPRSSLASAVSAIQGRAQTNSQVFAVISAKNEPGQPDQTNVPPAQFTIVFGNSGQSDGSWFVDVDTGVVREMMGCGSTPEALVDFRIDNNKPKGGYLFRSGAAVGSQTPAPQGPPLATSHGMPIYELKIGSPVGLPSDSLLYFSETCSVCTGGQLFRATLAPNGTWTREELVVKPPTGVPDGFPVGEFITDGKSRITVLWCEGPCGKRHDGTADTTPRAVLLSEDRGVSWRKIGSTTAGWVLLGYQADEVLAWTHEGQYMLYPSGQSVPVPAPGGYQGSGMPPGVNILSTTDSQLHLQLGNDSSSMVATFPTGGGPSAYHAFPEGRLVVTAALSATELMGMAERTHSDRALLDRLPVLVDLTTGTIAPISGLTPSAQNAYLNPLLLVRGSFARVHSGSDCLNVRDSASKSATALGCFADGVLLRLRSQPEQSSEGAVWVPVETQDGKPGWAAAEFLER